MDTATHFVLGISIAGLATNNPVISGDPVLAQGILISSIIASQAPDFDGVTRFWGGTANYIKNHRGITHSLPMILIWPTIITLLLSIIYPVDYFGHLWFWSLVSVSLHISLDILNAYGTQVLRPFSKKWISLDIINIFDPFIFVIHLSSILIWIIDNRLGSYIFIITFALTIIYILWRSIIHSMTVKYLKTSYNLKGKITLLPTIKWSVWNIIEETSIEYKLGILNRKQYRLVDRKEKKNTNIILEATKNDMKIKAFLYFTKYAYPEWKKTEFGYEVRWIDLRYRFNDHYPFLAIALLNEKYEIIDSYTGWIYSDKHLNKKVLALLNENEN